MSQPDQGATFVQATVSLPKAFSVREENEFFPIQHLMARLNPQLMVVQVATGKHVRGGYTDLWGVVYVNGHIPTKADVEAALREAGFDLSHGGVIQMPVAWPKPVGFQTGS